MNKMGKTILILAFGILSLSVSSANQVSWGCSSADGVIKDNAGIALSVVNAGDGMTALVQLVYAGSNDTIDTADQIGDGATGDDEVVAYAWLGANGEDWIDGIFAGDEIENSYADGSLYYIRAWENPALNIGSGDVPHGATYYGNSLTYAIQANGNNLPETFNAAGFNTTIAIPEPTVAAFIGVFGGGMLLARRLFAKQA